MVIFTKRRVRRFHAASGLSSGDITRAVNSFKFLPSSRSPPHFSFPACPLNIAGERLTNQAIFHTSRWCFAKRNETSAQLSLSPSLSPSPFFHSFFLRSSGGLGCSANDLNARKRFTNLLGWPPIGRLRYLERNTYQRISRDPLLTMSPVSPG